MVRDYQNIIWPIIGWKLACLRLFFLSLSFCPLILISSCTDYAPKLPIIYPENGQTIENKSHIAPIKSKKLAEYQPEHFYRVHGKKYVILSSSQHYEEQGIASWYGRRFHKQRTASGEPYNMLSMTAAHKTLPLPSYVLVTNLANGRSVVVKVNDHGPFVKNRLIDLSYAAGKKLGMIKHGIARVNIKVINSLEYAKFWQTEKTKKLSCKKPTCKHLVYLE